MHFSEYETRLAAYAVIVDDADRILLTWFNDGGGPRACWSMPGGGVEYEESIEQAVAREVFEETGYAVAVGSPLTCHSFTVPDGGRTGRPFKSVRVVFSATVTGGTLGTIEVGGTTDFARWIPLVEAATLAPRSDIIDVALTAMPMLN